MTSGHEKRNEDEDEHEDEVAADESATTPPRHMQNSGTFIRLRLIYAPRRGRRLTFFCVVRGDVQRQRRRRRRREKKLKTCPRARNTLVHSRRKSIARAGMKNEQNVKTLLSVPVNIIMRAGEKNPHEGCLVILEKGVKKRVLSLISAYGCDSGHILTLKTPQKKKNKEKEF